MEIKLIFASHHDSLFISYRGRYTGLELLQRFSPKFKKKKKFLLLIFYSNICFCSKCLLRFIMPVIK